jgi:hypothetical protein
MGKYAVQILFFVPWHLAQLHMVDLRYERL